MTNETDMPQEMEEFENDLSPQELMELAELEASLIVCSEVEKEALPNEGGMSYADIYASVLLNEEIIITIPAEIEERVKIGLRNHKARQLAKLKQDGAPIDSSSLSFIVTDSTMEGAIDMTITLKERSTVPIMSVKIPDNTF